MPARNAREPRALPRNSGPRGVFGRFCDRRPPAGRRSALLRDVTRLAVDSTGDGFAV